MIADITRQLREDEGVRPTVYRDHLGYFTIGVGRLVDPSKPGAGLRQSEIDVLLRNDITDRVQELSKALPWYAELDDARQGVLVNMAFQLGVQGLLGFKTTLDLIGKGRYADAAAQMLKSKWATQTPARAARLSQQMKTGKWVFQ
jgi:lysozyme